MADQPDQKCTPVLGRTGKTGRRTASTCPDGVQQTLSKEPRNFTDYARGTAATGIWESRR